MELTGGTLLGGRVAYQQPREGYRTGIEPVLLAASLPARAGMRVLEGGAGAGAGLLCLLHRVPGVEAVGVEQDAALAALGRRNLLANHPGTGTVLAGDLLALPPMPPFDHAMANPPWHDGGSTPSPNRQRDGAKRAYPGLLGGWAAALAGALRPGGSLTLALPAGALAEALGVMAEAGCGGMDVLPLWPRMGQEARLMLVRGVKGGRGPSRLRAGLVLHDGEGYSAAARQILWGGQPLAWP